MVLSERVGQITVLKDGLRHLPLRNMQQTTCVKVLDRYTPLPTQRQTGLVLRLRREVNIRVSCEFETHRRPQLDYASPNTSPRVIPRRAGFDAAWGAGGVGTTT